MRIFESIKPLHWMKCLPRLHLTVLTTRNETWRLLKRIS